MARPGAAAPSFYGLGDLPSGAFFSDARAITPDGRVVVGIGTSANGTEAFRWTADSGMIGLGDFEGGFFISRGYGVSTDGSVVVGVGNENFKNQAFRWTAATDKQRLADFPNILAHDNSVANAISADGSVIVGQISNSDPFIARACYWRGTDAPVDLGNLLPSANNSVAYAVSADGSVIVGSGNSASGREAFRWTAATGMVGLGDLPGGKYDSIAYAISADGSVIAGYANTAAGKLPMRWTADAGMQALSDSSSALGGEAHGASADGSIIVGKSTGLGAFIWDETHGIRSLQSVLTNDYGLDLADWKLDTAYAITPDGSAIVGTGKNPDGNTEAWLVVVPEPSSALLLFLLTPLTLRRRSR